MAVSAPTQQPATGRAGSPDGPDDVLADVVVVGAGFAGLYARYRFRELGLSVVGVEDAPDVGGTWYWNRYPGARCDVPSLFYSYSWSPELRAEWRWTEKYASQAEILDYARYAADRFGLRPLIRFSTRVTDAAFDEASDRWTVRTDTGETIRATYCIMATGCLSVPNEVALPGLEDFAGPTYHTARWPHEPVGFTGLRVGVVGTGSSAIQLIPVVAEDAAQLTVFQRTPNFSVPARNGPLDQADEDRFVRTFDVYLAGLESPDFGRVGTAAFDAPVPPVDVQRARYERLWEQGGGAILLAYPNLLTEPAVNDVAAEFVRDRIRSIVTDPVTAEALCPTGYPIGVKRICVDSGYYATFNQPNVALVDLQRDPIESVLADGVRTASGTVGLDALILATGFDAMTGALARIDFRGRNGVTLREAWAEGPRTYLGVAMAGFPNLFVITGPGSPSVIGNVIHNGEHHVDWIAGCIAHGRNRGASRIEADARAEAAWMDHVAEAAGRTLFPKANSWYLGANIEGKPRVFMPYVGQGYRHRCATIAADGYRGFRFD